MNDERANWRIIGSQPINAANPSGEPVRYEPDFERLQAEMQKLENFSGEPIDWKQVVTLSEGILRNKSKDLLVVSYLVLGLLETEGLKGLLYGLACLEGVVADHWPSLFPAANRMRARINALNWLSEKAGAAISRREPGADAGDTLGACEELVRSLEALLDEKAGPEEPVLGELYRPIQEYLSRFPAAGVDAGGPVVEPESAVPVKPAPAIAVPAAEPVDKVETPEDAKRSLKDAFGSLKKVAFFTRSQDPTRPLPYRLIRSLTWCEIDTLPPADNGKSRVPPPPNQLRDRFRTLSEQSSWKELVSQVEARVAEFPFWLDLHRICDTALTELGAEYVKARDAMKSEVGTLLGRLPDLIDIKFSDGTPFADESTRNWISGRLMPPPAAEPVAAAIPDTGNGFLEELRSKSRQLLQEGDPKSALVLAQEFIRSASTEREKFLAQMELVNLCIEAGHIKAALVHLETLDDQVRRYSLDAWEPQLASRVLSVYFHTLNKTLRESKQPAPDAARLADSIYGRLCRLDVLAGLNAIK